jgi:signal recognition particle subunit SEC65
MPEKDMLIIWPIYFDADRSRSEGRMVSKQDAVHGPTLDLVITAAIKSGFKPEIEREKCRIAQAEVEEKVRSLAFLRSPGTNPI